MPENLRELLRSLVQQRDPYLDFARREVGRIFQGRDRKPPPVFEDSSFLYMRSFDADTGVRPFSGPPHWRSPDISIRPVTSSGAYTTTLEAGHTYRIECLLRNRGDLGIPSAKVELFLTDPSLGFDTRFATNLTLGRVPSAWVGSGETAAAAFDYGVPPTESGHKCLFARAFSFSPLEMPVDDFKLDPRVDRHVAQLNLNIVGPGDAFGFQLVHLPNAVLRIELAPLEPAELLALRHPVLADVTPAQEFPRRGWGRMAQIHPRDAGDGVDVEPSQDGAGMHVRAEDREGINLDTQQALNREVHEVLGAVHAGRTRMSQHRELFARYRDMHAQARRTTFGMTVPDVGLQPGQAVGVDVRAVDEVALDGEVMGGFTLVIVGR